MNKFHQSKTKLIRTGTEKYHGRHERNAIDQASGPVPSLGAEEGIEIEKQKRPLKKKLEPNKANDEMRSLGH